MNMRQLLLAILSMLVGWGTAGVAQAAPTITFEAGDRPGNFFTCSNTANSKSLGCVPRLGALNTLEQQSLAVIAPGETVGFPSVSGEASTIHTALSLLWPTGATHDEGIPFSPSHPFKTAIDFLRPVTDGINKCDWIRQACMSSSVTSMSTCLRPSSWMIPIRHWMTRIMSYSK